MADQKLRPAAFETTDQVAQSRFHWYFASIPSQIKMGGQDISNPFRQCAIYVVHGMGDQRYTDTSAALRLGLEDALLEVDPRNWNPASPNYWVIPEPFVYDGFWGNYADIAQFDPSHWQSFTEREKQFFSRVWSQRAENFDSTWSWFNRQAKALIKRAPGLARLYYAWVLPQVLILVALMRLRRQTRRLVTGYLNDVRLFVEPHGDMEHAIAHQIERSVGEGFLKMLGLDWNFDDLLPCDQVNIGGQPYRFDRVVWLAHSLGTVVSFKVIGDLLRRCLEKRAQSPGAPPLNVLRVERGLATFVTIGSPLDKLRYLYGQNALLNDWPNEYLPGGALDLWKNSDDSPREFWHNFYYTSDPVSGHLDSFVAGTPPRNLVSNFHTQGPKLIGWAHVSYWSDVEFLKRLMWIAFPGLVISQKAQPQRARWKQEVLRLGAFLMYGVLTTLLLFGIVWFAWTWLQQKLEGSSPSA
jgi:hypothetical protein